MSLASLLELLLILSMGTFFFLRWQSNNGGLFSIQTRLFSIGVRFCRFFLFKNLLKI